MTPDGGGDAGGGARPVRWAWRAAEAFAAVLLLFGITASAERARPEASALGRALGLAAPDLALATAADAFTLRGVAPTPAEQALARHTAIAEPLSPLPYYLLGASSRVPDATAAVAGAVQRDPRFRPAYRWQAVALAKAGDSAGATRALIRLAVLSPTEQQLWPAVAQLTADPAASAVVKGEIARGAAWRDSFLVTLSAAPVDRAIVFEMVQAAGKPPSAGTAAPPPGQPDDHRAFLAELVARKDYERAYLAWIEWLPAASQRATGLVFDGGFTGAPALPPFAWALSDGVGGGVAIDPASGLTLDYSGTDGAVLAHQLVLLAPGRYRLVTDARFDAATNENGAPPLVWSLTCAPDQRPLGDVAVPLVGAVRRVGGAPFVLDDTCPAQVLALRVNSADFAKRLAGRVRAVAIEPVP